MKRNTVIACVTAAVLIGGGIATTAAFAHDDGGNDRDRVSRSADHSEADREGGDRATGERITLDEAVTAALKAVPGTVTEVELDDDDENRTVWELDVYGTDKVWYEVTVDPVGGKVLSAREDHDDDRARRAPRSAALSLDAAVDRALKARPGTVTSVELEDDDDEPLHWEIDVTGRDGNRYDLDVDAKTGKVTVERDDD